MMVCVRRHSHLVAWQKLKIFYLKWQKGQWKERALQRAIVSLVNEAEVTAATANAAEFAQIWESQKGEKERKPEKEPKEARVGVLLPIGGGTYSGYGRVIHSISTNFLL